MLREWVSSTKKARNQPSRKPTIIPSLRLRVFVPLYNSLFKDDLRPSARPLLRPPEWERDRSQSALVCLESPNRGGVRPSRPKPRSGGAIAPACVSDMSDSLGVKVPCVT